VGYGRVPIAQLMKIAQDLGHAVVEMVVTQGEEQPYVYQITCQQLHVFVLMCDCLNELGKQLPLADKINVEMLLQRGQWEQYVQQKNKENKQ
jgi:hypothetical protein